MPIKINYNTETGKVIQAYDSKIDPIYIPEPTITVTEEEWAKHNRSPLINDGKLCYDLIEYKKGMISRLSQDCNIERAKILSDTKIMNISTGATVGYPSYLTPDNVAKMIEIYKNIYHKVSAEINSVTDQPSIEAIISAIKWPTETDIISQLEKQSI